MALIAPAAPPLPAPWWPSEPIDPTRVVAAYDPPADELTVYFSDRVRGGVCDPIAEAEGGDVAVIYDEATGEIVGIQGFPFLVGAVAARSRWTRLAWALIAGEYGTEELRAELSAFVTEVRDLFDRYGTIGGADPTPDGT